MASNNSCKMWGFNKYRSSLCKSARWKYSTRKNVGRNVGTAMDYVVENYNSLPDIIIFTKKGTLELVFTTLL